MAAASLVQIGNLNVTKLERTNLKASGFDASSDISTEVGSSRLSTAVDPEDHKLSSLLLPPSIEDVEDTEDQILSPDASAMGKIPEYLYAPFKIMAWTFSGSTEEQSKETPSPHPYFVENAPQHPKPAYTDPFFPQDSPDMTGTQNLQDMIYAPLKAFVLPFRGTNEDQSPHPYFADHAPQCPKPSCGDPFFPQDLPDMPETPMIDACIAYLGQKFSIQGGEGGPHPYFLEHAPQSPKTDYDDPMFPRSLLNNPQPAAPLGAHDLDPFFLRSVSEDCEP